MARTLRWIGGTMLGTLVLIKVPTLLIWGALDTVTPLDQGRRLVTLLPAGRLEVLQGIGHIPQIEGPAAFNRTLLAFLAAIDGPR